MFGDNTLLPHTAVSSSFYPSMTGAANMYNSFYPQINPMNYFGCNGKKIYIFLINSKNKIDCFRNETRTIRSKNLC